MRPHPLEHLADQRFAQLLLAAGPVDPELDGGGDVAPRRLAVDTDRSGNRALALTLQPAPEGLFDLNHGYLPECRGASSPSASGAQPNVSSAGIGGPSGWSHNWQAGWSHPAGKTGGHLVPCHWQTTPRRPSTHHGPGPVNDREPCGPATRGAAGGRRHPDHARTTRRNRAVDRGRKALTIGGGRSQKLLRKRR
jgi:hypothetical protein